MHILQHPVSYESSLSSFRIPFNEPLLRNVQKCTNARHVVSLKKQLTLNFVELDKCVGLIAASSAFSKNVEFNFGVFFVQ